MVAIKPTPSRNITSERVEELFQQFLMVVQQAEEQLKYDAQKRQERKLAVR